MAVSESGLVSWGELGFRQIPLAGTLSGLSSPLLRQSTALKPSKTDA